jgi:hypothetical protein
MPTFRTIVALVIGLLMLGGPTVPTASAQRPLPPGAEEAMTPGEMQRLFDAYAAMQAQETLGLSDKQYGEFVVRLRALQQVRRRQSVERARLMRELNALSRREPPAPDVEMKTALDALAQHDARARDEVARAYSNVDELLTLRQRARFRVFEDQVERRKLDLLARARLNRLRRGAERP